MTGIKALIGAGGGSGGSFSGSSSPGYLLNGIRHLKKRSDYPTEVKTDEFYFTLGNGNTLKIPTSVEYIGNSTNSGSANTIVDQNGNTLSYTSYVTNQNRMRHVAFHQRQNGDICVVARHYTSTQFGAMVFSGVDGSLIGATPLIDPVEEPTYSSMYFDEVLGKYICYSITPGVPQTISNNHLEIESDGSVMIEGSTYIIEDNIVNADVPCALALSEVVGVWQLYIAFPGKPILIKDFSGYTDIPGSTNITTSSFNKIVIGKNAVHLVLSNVYHMYPNTVARLDRNDFFRWVREIFMTEGGLLP